jgi:hypothetical protein
MMGAMKDWKSVMKMVKFLSGSYVKGERKNIFAPFHRYRHIRIALNTGRQTQRQISVNVRYV